MPCCGGPGRMWPSNRGHITSSRRPTCPASTKHDPQGEPPGPTTNQPPASPAWPVSWLQGEPDREMAEGILEQGARLAEVVGALQAALHPPMPAAAAAALGAGAPGSLRPSAAIPSAVAAAAVQQPRSGGMGRLPALLPPASSGGDWSQPAEEASATSPSSGTSSGGGSGSSSQPPAGQQPPTSGGASTDLVNVLMPLLAAASNLAAVNGVSLVLVPPSGAQDPGLIDLAEAGRSQASSSSSSTSSSGGGSSRNSGGGSSDSEAAWSNGTSEAASRIGREAGGAASREGRQGWQQQQQQGGAVPTAARPQPAPHHLPSARVAVGAGVLRRMLSQLLDGMVACAARGDTIQAWVRMERWEGRPGVLVGLCCLQGIVHASASSSSSSSGSSASGRPPVAAPDPLLRAAHGLRRLAVPEFAFLESMTQQAGGRFEARADARPTITADLGSGSSGGSSSGGWGGQQQHPHQHVPSASVCAQLWLPALSGA